MATKFSSVFKQELKSRGALESLGSTVVKSMAERVDLRNVLFGGKGFVAKTGRKIFGKGYDPIERAKRITPDSSAAVAAVATLQESNKRQEDALKIIVKNTMNMNMMARDMNITRQNIASLTKAVTGKSSRGADALWMNAARRDREDRSTAPTKVGGSSSSILSGVLGGVMGIGGSAGSMIFRALGSIIAISPIVGIVGIAAAGYAIKKMAEDIDFKGMFESVKNNIMKFLGIDPESDEPILKQLASKLNAVFSTTRFTDIYDWVEKNFGEDFKKIGKMISDTTKEIMIYSETAFRVLGNAFGKLGEIFAFHFGQFINQYKPELLATVGASIGASVGSLFGIKGAALGLLIGSGAGYLLGKVTKTRTPDEITSDIETQESKLTKLKNDLEQEKKINYLGKPGGRPLMVSGLERDIETAENNLRALNEERYSFEERVRQKFGITTRNLGLTGENFSDIERQVRETRQQPNTTPEKISDFKLTDSQKRYAQMIYDEFYKEFKSDTIARAAVANAYEESRLTPDAKNRDGRENSLGLFQINLNDEANRAFLAKEYRNPFLELLDPKTNIEAMIKLMKTAPGNITKLKQEGTVEGATRRMMLDFLRPKDQGESAISKRIGNITVANAALGREIADRSTDLATNQRTVQASTPPIIQNINNTAASKPASQNMPSPQAYNMDAAELFFAPLLRGIN